MSDFATPCFAIVAEDFSGEEEGELTLFAGEKVIIYHCSDDGWFDVMTKTECGIFPGSYVDFEKKINIPCPATITMEIVEMGLLPGESVQIQEFSSEGILIRYGSEVGYCSWAEVDIGVAAPVRKPALVKESDNSIIGVAPIRPKSKILEPSAINMPKKVTPNLAKTKEAVPMKPTQAKPLNNRVSVNQLKAPVAAPAAPPRNKPNNPSPVTNAPKAVNPLSKTLPKSVAISAPEKKENEPTRAEAKPGEMHNSRFSTYRRPISVFGDVIEHDDYSLMGKQTLRGNLYEVSMEGERMF